MRQNRILRSGPVQKLAVILLWLGIWQLVYVLVGKDVLFASPETTVRRLASLASTADFWSAIGATMYRIMLGYVIGLAAGIVVAVLTSWSKLLYSFFSLPLGLVKSTPVASFTILALVWIQGKNLSVFISFIMIFPLAWSNAHEGIASADIKLLEMARAFKLTRRDIIKNIYYPSVLPYMLSVMRVGLGFCWKSGIAAEVIAIPAGTIGARLYTAKVYLETGDLFAWTAVVILMSVLLEKVIVALISAADRRIYRTEVKA